MVGLISLVLPFLMTSGFPSVVPLPSPQQMEWQNMETNAFVHFGPNTFTDLEWGGGREDPNLFNPPSFIAINGHAH